MTNTDLDLSNLPRFLDHLEERDAGSARFARQLIDAGGVVRVLWGPLQMDVWEVRVQRGEMIARFGVERGFSDGVLIGPAGPSTRMDLLSMRLALTAWAGATGVPFQVEDPDEFALDLASNGIAALDWVGAGNEARVTRVTQAWFDYRAQLERLMARTRRRPAESDLQAVRAAGSAAIERAARA